MSNNARTAKGKRYVVIPWITPDGKEVEKVVFAKDITPEEVFGIVGEMMDRGDTAEHSGDGRSSRASKQRRAVIRR